MKNLRNKAISTLFGALAVANMMTMTAFAEGDVAGAVTSTWPSAKSQIKSVVDNVVFPVIDVILVILLFVKIGTMYLEYKKTWSAGMNRTGDSVRLSYLHFDRSAVHLECGEYLMKVRPKGRIFR